MNPRLKKTLLLIGKVALVVAILASIASALGSYKDELFRLTTVNTQVLVLSIVMCIIYRLTNAHGWWMVLDSMKQRLPRLASLRIWLMAEACRWLPGSVWSYGSRAYQAKQNGVPPAPACASLFLELFLTLLAWLVTAFVGLVMYRQAFLKMVESLPLGPAAFYISIGVFAVLIVGYFLRSAISNKFNEKFAKLMVQVRSLGEVKPDMWKATKTFLYYTFMCFFNGITFYYVLKAVAPEANVPLFAVIGANAASWLVGFFAFMAPGGLVVREGALAALLVAWLPMEVAIASAIIWRMIQIAVELLCMFFAYGIYLVQGSQAVKPAEQSNSAKIQPTA